jgi:uncharacterized protein YecE (DUF72 family)
VWIGTSGWQYRHWRERLYPRGLAQARWLEHYAARFATVESNNAFYMLPERATFERWRERTPTDFCWAVKVSRYLTHIRRLAEPDEPVERFVRNVTGLAGKLGPVLLQLPPSLRLDADRLARTLDRFPAAMRVAVEFRHDSWYTDDVRRLLEQCSAALCLADRRGPLMPEWRTAPWGYVRFHTGRASPAGCYGRTALSTWADRLARLWRPDEDVFVYFNNDPQGCAPRDAVWFAAACRRAGLEPTRVPTVRDTPVG